MGARESIIYDVGEASLQAAARVHLLAGAKEKIRESQIVLEQSEQLVRDCTLRLLFWLRNPALAPSSFDYRHAHQEVARDTLNRLRKTEQLLRRSRTLLRRTQHLLQRCREQCPGSVSLDDGLQSRDRNLERLTQLLYNPNRCDV
jgi:hypothetical protein